MKFRLNLDEIKTKSLPPTDRGRRRGCIEQGEDRLPAVSSPRSPPPFPEVGASCIADIRRSALSAAAGAGRRRTRRARRRAPSALGDAHVGAWGASKRMRT